MISILVPVFNRDVNELISTLSAQAKELQQGTEIIIMDDGSDSYYRQLHSSFPHSSFLRYFESGKNYGRIRTRQMLCELATFDWLLFLDCDSFLISEDWLQNFYRRIADDVHVVVGGRVYSPEKPVDCNLRLHWKYGSKREKTKPASTGYVNRFMTNNLFIRKTVFNRFDFTGQWEGYGYEDTWMGIQLESINIPVMYIDNPVKHAGLEDTSTYLAKSREALQNLEKLSKLVPKKILVKHVKLYFYFYKLQSWRLLWILRVVYAMLSSTTRRNLHTCNPSLILFDLYRLNYFAKLAARNL